MKTLAIALLGTTIFCVLGPLEARADDKTAPPLPASSTTSAALAPLPPAGASTPPAPSAPPPAQSAPRPTVTVVATAPEPEPPPAPARAPRPLPLPAPVVHVAAPSAPPPMAPPPPQPGAEEDGPVGPVNYRVEMWRVEVAYRGSFVNDAGYGPFSTNQYFVEASFGASRTLWHEGDWSFAPGIGLDLGGSSATARGQPSSMSMQRVNIPLEGRRHFGPWGYAFVRVAPGLALENTEIDDASAPSPLKKNAWMFATDVSAGYAWLIVPRLDRFEQKARLWLQTDVGYGWVVGDELALAVSSGGSGNTNGVDLGSLSMSGPFFRLGAALSF